MINFTQAAQSKSDQLNASDLVQPLVIKIRGVTKSKDEKQPMFIYYQGDNGKPFKPSLGMRKIILAKWGFKGEDGELYLDPESVVGNLLELYNEPTVTYGGKEIGGIRISGMSDIEKQFDVSVKRNRSQVDRVTIKKLVQAERAIYPQDRFEKQFDKMKEMMESKEMTLQAVIIQCQKTGDLTQEQLTRLEQAAPIEHDENEEPI